MRRVFVLSIAVLATQVGFAAWMPSSRHGCPSVSQKIGENPPPPTDGRLESQYLAVVERYRQGEPTAIPTILVWKEIQIRVAVDALSRLIVRGRAPRATMAAGEIAARTKAAAIMLHTDAGIVEIVQQGKPESLHLKTAHALLLQSAASPLGALDSSLEAFTLRNWVLAVVQSLVNQMAYEPARSLLGSRTGYPALPDETDRDLILTAGWLEESAAFYGVHVLVGGAGVASVPTELEATAFMTRNQQAGRERLRVQEARERAEKLYRRVLHLDPACDEARLRLGRVLFDEGRSGEAIAQLEPVVAHSHDSRQTCLAALFLGAVREKDGEINAAARWYTKAVEADPRSQAARVALSAALAAAGQSAAAQGAIEPLTTRRTVDAGYRDPWAGYVLGQADSDRLTQLRKLVVER